MEQSGQEPNRPDQPGERGQLSNIDPRLLQYVSDARRAGLHDEIIWDELKNVGWSDEEIKRALRS